MKRFFTIIALFIGISTTCFAGDQNTERHDGDKGDGIIVQERDRNN